METSDRPSQRHFASALALAQRALSTFRRFPLSILSAVVAASAASLTIQFAADDDPALQALWPIVMAAILGIPLFYVLRVYSESSGLSRWARLGSSLAGLAALVLYYRVLPVPVKGADVVSYLLILAGVLLAASFLPFLGRAGEQNGFWQYNKLMFLRLAAAALFSFVLWTGLSLALAACDALLGINVEGEVYGQLWYWVALVYSSWFFLAGIPPDVRALQDARDYPTALRVFTQYVLIPLVVLYLIILYAYTVKILVQWELPTGWVGFPVIGVSTSGLLALLLVHPIAERAEHKWIVPYSRFFYWALYPLIALIAIALWTRIDQYGVTEKRYLVVVATAWLLGIALYFTLRRAADIRIIPVSLCAVSLLSAFGPWGATAFARRSQLSRLQDMLVAEGVMAESQLDAAPMRIPFDREKEISNVVRYVIDFHGADRIRDWYARPEALPDDLTPTLAMEEMGLEYVHRWQAEPEGFSIEAAAPNPLRVDGFDYVYRVSCCVDDDIASFDEPLGPAGRLSMEGEVIRLGLPADSTDLLRIDLAPWLARLNRVRERGQPIATEDATLAAENERYRLVFYLDAARGSGQADSLSLSYLGGTILVRLK